MKFIVGIDEAGRGPLAGPVAVGVVKVASDFDWGLIEGVNDSKKLSPEKRAALFRCAKELRKAGVLDFTVAMIGPKYIDDHGIVRAIALAMARAVKRLELQQNEVFIKLDGSLKASPQFQQETIIKGDQKELVIGLASIVAKETRDAFMRRIAKHFVAYGFDQHMGYGTKSHRTAIRKYGISTAHRKTYCKNCLFK